MSCESGPNKSTVDIVLVRNGEKRMFGMQLFDFQPDRNIKDQNNMSNDQHNSMCRYNDEDDLTYAAGTMSTYMML